jgi:hypothetical protein
MWNKLERGEERKGQERRDEEAALEYKKRGNNRGKKVLARSNA